MVNQNLYQGFSETFLKKEITVEDGKINVFGKDYYQVLGINNVNEYLNQEIGTYENKLVDDYEMLPDGNRGAYLGKKTVRSFVPNEKYKEMKKAFSIASRKAPR